MSEEVLAEAVFLSDQGDLYLLPEHAGKERVRYVSGFPGLRTEPPVLEMAVVEETLRPPRADEAACRAIVRLIRERDEARADREFLVQFVEEVAMNSRSSAPLNTEAEERWQRWNEIWGKIREAKMSRRPLL